MEFAHNASESEKEVTKPTTKHLFIIWGGLATLITTLPYIFGFFVQNEQFVFSGFLFGVEDGNSYIAKMLLGSLGDWLFRSPYSAVNQNGLFAFFPYLLLGKLAGGSGLHEQLISLYQLFRIAGTFFLVYVYIRFFELFFDKNKLIQLGLLLVLFGAGWDWLLLLFGLERLPISFYSPETFGFLSIFGLPHLCFSRGFMLLGIMQLFRWDFANTAQPFIRTGLFFLLAALFQPLNLVIAYTVFGIWWLFSLLRKKFVFQFNLVYKQSLAVLISLPAFLYYFWIVNADPFMKQWTAQNILPSPPFADYLFAFGPLIIALILEVLIFKKSQEIISDDRKIILLLWVAISFILVYLPINVQRRLMDGVWLANIILLLPIIGKIRSHVLRWIVIGSMLITPIILLIGAMVSVLNPTAPQFISRERAAAYKQLVQTVENNAVILAPFDVSNELPAYGKLRVVTGHGPESINKLETEKFLDYLYSYQINHTTACEFLNEHMIKYIWFNGNIYNENQIHSIFKTNEVSLVIDYPDYKVLKIAECKP
jgi:uncharacterized membrane protein (DUF485 family)